jgi:putative ABC transport system ATP-binding protein
MTPVLIETSNLDKKYHFGREQIHALKGVNLRITKGRFVSIRGPSGSGKSTLLYILGCLTRPTSGCYRLNGLDLDGASDKELSKIRGKQVGFVFQTYNLIPQLNVYENVSLPFLYHIIPARAKGAKILKAIDAVGLSHRLHHRPAELSGGEMQRVAIARALVNEPEVILADEPTGNLDSATGQHILDLFMHLHASGATIIIVTHDEGVAAAAEMMITLKDGQTV